MHITPRRLVPVLLASGLLLAACGGSDGDDTIDSVSTTAATTTPTDDSVFTEVEGTDGDGTGVESPDAETTVAADDPAETAAPEPAETAAPTPEETVAPDTTVAAEPAPTEGPAEAGGTAVDVSMIEWAIEAPTEYAAGPITFNAINNGTFPHELLVIAGEGYESLPLEQGGSVNEDELPTGALIGLTDQFGAGESESLTVDLTPGNYVLLCNLGGGANSHAGAGQRLDISVS